jgi:hypothetical protein
VDSDRTSSHDRVPATDPTTPRAAENGPSMAQDGHLDRTLPRDLNPDSDHLAGEEQPPPLPPRPSLLRSTNRSGPRQSAHRPSLQAKATTFVSSVDIQTLSFPDGSRGTFSTPGSRAVSESVSGLSGGQNTPNRKVSRSGSELDDSASLMSHAPTLRANRDLASLLDEGLKVQSAAWRLLNAQVESARPFETVDYEDTSLANFQHEFDEIEPLDSKGGNEGRPIVFLSFPHLIHHCRRDPPPMESKIQALHNPIICGEANL